MKIIASRNEPAAVTLPKRETIPGARRWPHSQGCQLCFEERGVTTVAAFRIGAKCRKRLLAIAYAAGVEWNPKVPS